MMNEKKIHNILLIIALCLMTLGFFTVYFQNKTPKIIEKRDTTIIRDTVWKDTTIIEKQLVPKEVIKQKIDTVFTPSGDSLLLVTEKKTFERSLTMGLDTVDATITTEGINTSLESLKMRLRLHQVNTQEIVEITKYEKNKGFQVKPSIGVGYGITSRKIDGYVGISLIYNF